MSNSSAYIVKQVFNQLTLQGFDSLGCLNQLQILDELIKKFEAKRNEIFDEFGGQSDESEVFDT